MTVHATRVIIRDIENSAGFSANQTRPSRLPTLEFEIFHFSFKLKRHPWDLLGFYFPHSSIDRERILGSPRLLHSSKHHRQRSASARRRIHQFNLLWTKLPPHLAAAPVCLVGEI
ncbi:hypothetical protein KSP40_PGU020254 [Platanthera guangdongensis]|uniref:Uncharacterized protein n=1 Tax=Platanthera guangdongensis TaxID=2320717 RepID=A0ABR2LGD2_9ASPA